MGEKSSLLCCFRGFMDDEARSCSMDPGCITPEYVFRMWGGKVPLEEIDAALNELKHSPYNHVIA